MRLVVLGSILLSVGAFACGSPDYDTHFQRRSVASDTIDPTTPSGGGTTDTVAPAGDPSTTTTSPSGGATPPAAAAADGGTGTTTATTTDAFTGAPAYVATTGASTNVAAHGTNGNPAGKACFSCHGNGGTGPSMTMGGTVYADAAGTTPLSQAEIRLVVGGTAISAYTNATGNFFVLGNPFAGSAMVGARDATSTHAMVATTASGDCNSCHDGTTTARIHLP